MNVYHGITSFDPPDSGVVLSIGNFDGVHRGHRRLVQAAQQRGRDLGLPVVLMTFEPHPLAVVAPDRAPAALTTISEKSHYLGRLGPDALIVLHSDRDLLSMSAAEFLDKLAGACRPRAIVEGPTFNFGRGRSGSVNTLVEHSSRLGYSVAIVDELHSGDLRGSPAINSSAIRAALNDGRLLDANEMLGRPYRVVGVVGGGHQRGAEIGFPTANLDDIPHLIPKSAVYAAIAQLDDSSLTPAAVNIGPQPTFDQAGVQVEAHLLDFSGDLRGRRVGLHLLTELREQRRFPDANSLVEQLRVDVERARAAAAQVDRSVFDDAPGL
jgi:riboflavin kinase/FMN adenylyltransferase